MPTTTANRTGFVIEETLSGCAPQCCHKFVVIPSADFGQDVFNDMTDGLPDGTTGAWETLYGRCPACRAAVTFRQRFCPVREAGLAASPAPAPGPSIREQTMEAHLARIVAAEDWFFTMNEHGTAAEFQRAADDLHDAIDAARDYLAR